MAHPRGLAPTVRRLRRASGDVSFERRPDPGLHVGDVDTASWALRSIDSMTMAYPKRELLTADEIMRLDSSLEIPLRQGQPPVVAQKVCFYADREFVDRFGP